MDNEQAKFILQAYRPGGQDENDPQMAGALKHARRDPELSRWLEEEQALNRALADRLKSISVPAGLKESIIAGGKIIRPRPWWRQPAFITAAACVAGLLAVMYFSPLPSRKNSAVEAQRFAIDFLSGLDSLEYIGDNPEELRNWLAANRGHESIALTPGLKKLPAVGCCVGDWKGGKVSLICFKAGTSGFRDEVHLFVFDRKTVPDLPGVVQPNISEQGDWVLASWSRAQLSYVLARFKSKDSLKKLL